VLIGYVDGIVGKGNPGYNASLLRLWAQSTALPEVDSCKEGYFLSGVPRVWGFSRRTA
jgi:hypothetical protein